jgi:hypothetical protein
MSSRRLSPIYSSGHDFAVEVSGVRFRFSAEDFTSRVGAAAVRLGLLAQDRLGRGELEDLVAMAAHGRIARPASPLAAHLERHRDSLVADDHDLVHWLRRLVFRGAWIDQQVNDGRIDPVFEEEHGFRYRSAGNGGLATDEAPAPDWSAFRYGRAAA